MRVVVDTSVLVSAALFDESVPRSALVLTMRFHTPLVSDAMIREYGRVMSSSKFDAYTPRNERLALLATYIQASDQVEIPGTLHICRDPRDNMVIETAFEGKANALITGDDDILSLRPLKGINIMTPEEFVKKLVAYKQGGGFAAHVAEKDGT
ncbi:MAG: putative toxin-antitoxin system toxin component, PIN family [Patescibacteria group bacterium]